MNLDDIDLIVFLSVPRSGHNAVMNWFMSQMTTRCTFYSTSEGVNDPQLRKKKFQSRKKKNVVVYNEDGESDIEVLNAEIVKLTNLPNLQKTPFVSEKRVLPIIILRSYRNHVASLMNAERIGDGNVARYRECWLEHANAVKGGLCDFILFDRWFVDENYRKSICDRYGLVFTDKGKQDIPRIGAPSSSFDQCKFDGKAEEMNVLERWKQVDQARLANMTKATQQLENEIFGPT